MLAQTRTSDLELFMRLSKRTDIATPDAAPLTILVPAFVTSELKTAFQIGFMIFIPFLIIDLVVASVLMAMGMMMLSPLIISLPFKIMLFVVHGLLLSLAGINPLRFFRKVWPVLTFAFTSRSSAASIPDRKSVV